MSEGALAPAAAPQGSAAWRAEQIATGQMPIPTVPRPQPELEPSKRDWGVTFGRIWRGIRLVRYCVLALALVGGAYRQLHNGGPSGAEMEAAFVPLYDYEYEQIDDPALESLETQLRSYAGLEDVLTGVEGKAVTKDGVRVAVVMVYGVDTEGLDGDPLDGAFPIGNGISGFAMGGPDGGFNGWRFTRPEGLMSMFYDDDGLIIQVVGPDEQVVDRVTSEVGLGNL